MVKISILVPSYNQAEFIAETLRSVPDDPSIEVIVMDGGSSDETASIVRNARGNVTFISEKDRGQSHALNKALALATGDWIGWQNSDDFYLPEAFTAFRSAYESDRLGNQAADVYFGHADIVDVRSKVVFEKFYVPFSYRDLLLNGFGITNQSAFFRRSTLLKIGGWDESLHHCMDYDLYVRLALNGAKFRLINRKLGAFRVHEQAKSSNMHDTRVREWAHIIKEKTNRDPRAVLRTGRVVRPLWLTRRLCFLILQRNIHAYVRNRISSWRRGSRSSHPGEYIKR